MKGITLEWRSLRSKWSNWPLLYATNLTDFGVELETSEALDGLPVHLADTYEICVAYTNIVDSFLELRASQITEAKNLTAQIDHQLYEHLPYHLKRLSPGLKAFSKKLDKPLRP